MKNKIKFFITSYFLFLGFGIISCDDCGPFPDRFKVTDIDWRTYEAIFLETQNNKLNLAEINQNSVLYNKFSIFIEPRKETYFSVINKINSINLIGVAYACDPTPPETNDNIENIEIFANKDFNSNHLSGENLVGIFDIIIFDAENEIYYEKFDLETYLISKPKVPTEMTLILKDAPIETSDFKFTIKYYQNGKDVNYLEFETNSIEIRK
jgi:hypothetical protein